jgi:hypothetical protein
MTTTPTLTAAGPIKLLINFSEPELPPRLLRVWCSNGFKWEVRGKQMKARISLRIKSIDFPQTVLRRPVRNRVLADAHEHLIIGWIILLQCAVFSAPVESDRRAKSCQSIEGTAYVSIL